MLGSAPRACRLVCCAGRHVPCWSSSTPAFTEPVEAWSRYGTFIRPTTVTIDGHTGGSMSRELAEPRPWGDTATIPSRCGRETPLETGWDGAGPGLVLGDGGSATDERCFGPAALRALLTQIPVGVLLTDREGRPVYENHAARRLLELCPPAGVDVPLGRADGL